MLGRLYAVIFLLTIAISLWYQKKYLEESSELFQEQLNSENTVLPTSKVKSFHTNSYEDGILKYSFSGDKITYFTDNHFEAEGNLIYKAYDPKQNETAVIKTSKATGQVEVKEEQDGQSSLAMGANSRIKFANLPENVFFDFNENIGKTSNVYIDMINENIHSTNSIESNGPQGRLKGKGFYYSIRDEEFKIKSQVDGKVILPNNPKNKTK